MVSILIGSPVRQTPEVLTEFLRSLSDLESDGFSLSYCFVDDNADPVSSHMLRAFAANSSCHIIPGFSTHTGYDRSNITHMWPDEAMWRVAAYKDKIIDFALSAGFDGLFLVDSDLVLHPKTLRQLWATEKEIVSEVFWTRWLPGSPALPQVWESGQANQPPGFVDQLRYHGVYPVGGLGACTLIRREVLVAGVRFERVPGLSLVGEDRHFCARATALGFGLYADTHFPAYHIYRDTDLKGVPHYRAAMPLRTQEVELSDLIRHSIEQSRLGGTLDGVASSLTVLGVLHLHGVSLGAERTQAVVHIEEATDRDGMRVRREHMAHVYLERVAGAWEVAHIESRPLTDSETLASWLRGRANELIHWGDIQGARQLLVAHRTTLMYDPELLSTLAVTSILEGKFQDALEFLLSVLPIFPRHVGLLFSLAHVYEVLGDTNRARALYSFLCSLSDNDPELALECSQRLTRLGRSKEIE